MCGMQNGAQQYGAYGAPQGPATRTPQYGSHQSTGQHGNEPLIITGARSFSSLHLCGNS